MGQASPSSAHPISYPTTGRSEEAGIQQLRRKVGEHSLLEAVPMPSGWSAPQPVRVHGQSTPTVCPQAREPRPWRQLCSFLLSSQFSAEQKQDRNLQRAGPRLSALLRLSSHPCRPRAHILGRRLPPQAPVILFSSYGWSFPKMCDTVSGY